MQCMTRMEPNDTMEPLFETIVKEIPAPQGDMNGGTQILFSNIDYDQFVGRIGVGRVERGEVKVGMPVSCPAETAAPKMQELQNYSNIKV